MKQSQLLICVVLPTLNVRPSLPTHLAQLRTWVGLAGGIIVVDSRSTDGTPELLLQELHHLYG